MTLNLQIYLLNIQYFINYMYQHSKWYLFYRHCVILGFCTHTDIYSYSTFDLYFIPYTLYIYLHLHDMCFNIFESFITFIISKRIKFKCSVLFGTHSLLDMLLTILQLPVHLSKVIEMDSNIIFQCID